MQQSTTNESQLTSQKIDTRLMFTPSPPGIPVQAGDIVGIRLPPVNDDMLTIKPLFLRLPQENSTISCAGLLGDTTIFRFDTANRMCGGNDPGEQQSLYIPLISVNINTDIPPSVSPSPTPPATTTIAPTPPPIDLRTIYSSRLYLRFADFYNHGLGCSTTAWS